MRGCLAPETGMGRRSASEVHALPDRERIDTGTSKRYIRRDAKGRFTKDQVAIGSSLTHDRRVKAKHASRKGQGDRGDRRTR
jgi:hypothetical protein